MEKITSNQIATAPAGTKARISRCTDQQVLPVIYIDTYISINLSVTLYLRRLIYE